MDTSHLGGPLMFGATLAGIVWLFQFSIKWKRHRTQYRDLPCPPHSFWWGHLKVMGDAVASLPPDAHPQVALAMIKDKYGLGHVFYLDLWPLADPMMLIHDPGVAAQITQTKNLPKHTLVKKFLRGMTGEHSIVSTEGQEWRQIRSMLSPGFAAQQIMAMAPTMVKHIKLFKEKLLKAADTGEIFLMQELASWVTIDVIGEVVLGKNLDSQNDPSGIADNFRNMISWAGSSFNVVTHTLASFAIWWYAGLIDRDLKGLIVERYKGHEFDTAIQKTTVDLALQAYHDEKLGTPKTNRTRLEPDFLQIAVNNIKTLLLGGHETTATTLSYAFFLLSTHPEVLAQVRVEHDSVFGAGDPADMIESDPRSLNQLHLTTATLREALRIFPAGSTMRMCLPSSPIQTVRYQDRVLPLPGHALWINHYGIGRREDLWEDALSFKPSRFMPGTEQPKDAFRSFEKGPRSCLGMEMAMMEMKIVLVLTLKELDFEPAYPSDCPKAPHAYGGEHYQMVEFGPKPAMHMPMRARKRAVAT